jgi:[ribosomal protein S18]-alanine N-acetyltransferase
MLPTTLSKLSSINVVKLDPSNTEKLYKFLIKNQDMREFFHPHPFTLDYLVYLIINRTKDFYCVAILNDEVIAYGMLRGWEEGYEIPSLGIAVDKDYRKLGIGTFMCQYLHFIAKIRGSEKVRLRVHKDNEKAKTVYEKLGYVFKGFEDSEYLEGFVNL